MPLCDRALHCVARSTHCCTFVQILRQKRAAGPPLQALNRQGWKAVAVHGDASQAQRTAAVDSFKVI